MPLFGYHYFKNSKHDLLNFKILKLKSIKVCEIHGKEKTGWTYLNDHFFKNNSPLEVRNFDYHPGGTLPTLVPSHAINYHRFSKYGAWKDAKSFYNLFDGGQSIVDFFADRKNQCEGWWPLKKLNLTLMLQPASIWIRVVTVEVQPLNQGLILSE